MIAHQGNMRKKTLLAASPLCCVRATSILLAASPLRMYVQYMYHGIFFPNYFWGFPFKNVTISCVSHFVFPNCVFQNCLLKIMFLKIVFWKLCFPKLCFPKLCFPKLCVSHKKVFTNSVYQKEIGVWHWTYQSLCGTLPVYCVLYIMYMYRTGYVHLSRQYIMFINFGHLQALG